MPIQYDLKTIGLYSLITVVLFALNYVIVTPYPIVNYAIKTVLLLLFVLLIVKRDFPVSGIPVLKRIIK
ncbi:MAG: lipopolysaccharide biosynthesis protein, partial [Paludibacter sp.]